MNYKPLLLVSTLLPSMNVIAEKSPDNEIYEGEDMIITTGHKLFPNTAVSTPSFEVIEEDINKTNLITASDAIKMAPSVHVRRRFYGDTNGVTAIRGSTNFQTNHFNMYVDGIPLHNPVQTKWNGAPKWSLVAPNAIHSAKVFYGPYSVEHRGAFGGSFDLKTKLPEEFEMHMDVTGIIQDSHRFGKDEILTGHKEFVSAGDRFGNWAVYGFYNHLENEGQPQSFAATTDPIRGNAGTNVTGSYLTNDVYGVNRIISGDKGINENITDLFQFKVAYDFNEDLRALFTIAYEDTTRNSQSRSYIQDSNNNTLWDGVGVQNGFEFDINPSSFGRGTLNGTENERQTLAYAMNLSGKITENWSIDTTASFFDAFKDETLESSFSQNNPLYAEDKSGRINDVEVWWVDYSIKLATQKFFDNDDIGFMAGYQFNHSFLDLDSWDSSNVAAGSKDAIRESNINGGSTETHSLFMQGDVDITENINIMGGVRYDHWQAMRGHISNIDLADRDASRASPKFSMVYRPIDYLSMRYSFSKAYRFPVAEELFESSTNTNSVNISDPNLGPETGYFHDLKFQYDLVGGFTSLTLFYNTIEDEILRTSTILSDGTSSNRTRSIDTTEALGIEFAYVQDYIYDLPVGLALNGTWINKEIKQDINNPDNIGKEWARIPRWRANGTLTYHTTEVWDNTVAVQYRSDQFGQDDNSDTYNNVYGSSDDYVLVNFKSAYKMDVGHDTTVKFSVGIDNILDENYYDHHPYPQRTYFANIALDI